MSIIAHPAMPAPPAALHPSWCDPRECHIRDHRPDGAPMLLVHAATVWAGRAGRAGRRLELIQTQTLDHAGNPVRTHQPIVTVHGELGGFDARAAAKLAQAWVRAADLAATSLPVSPEVAAVNALIDCGDPR